MFIILVPWTSGYLRSKMLTVDNNRIFIQRVWTRVRINYQRRRQTRSVLRFSILSFLKLPNDPNHKMYKTNLFWANYKLNLLKDSKICIVIRLLICLVLTISFNTNSKCFRKKLFFLIFKNKSLIMRVLAM